jgi:hypothetical protein
MDLSRASSVSESALQTLSSRISQAAQRPCSPGAKPVFGNAGVSRVMILLRPY